jgi:hypothetical protein
MKQYLRTLVFLCTIISCSNKEKNHNQEGISNYITYENISDFKIKGDSIVAKTFDTLRKTLLTAVKENGFDGAVEFCNTRALSLTNSYSVNNITIKRTSDKLRNKTNAPDSMEQRILTQFLQMANSLNKLAAVVEKDKSGKVHYYKPIIMQGMCLNCHGDQEQIQPAILAVIKSKYPDDLAVDYKEGEFRGMWHVTFKE